jgi:MarR-like DNA-binding transcriptional regulator SgrR of sgrS sRNA
MALPRFSGGYPNSGQRRHTSRTDTWIIIGAIILFIVGLGGFFFDLKSRKNEVPVEGGTYTEGVLADSPTKVERVTARLTSIGLTYRDSDNTIKPALAKSWEVSDEGKKYVFTLQDGYDVDSTVAILQSSKNWSGITISKTDDGRIEFLLPESLSLFLGTTTAPLFPYGPYEVVKRDKNETILRANEQFAIARPYIQKVVIKSYESRDELIKAADGGEIDGSADFATSPGKLFQQYTIEVPRYYILFFNVTRNSFKKVDDRQRVVDAKDGNPVSYSLLTSQTGIASDLADALARELAPHNIKLEIKKSPSATLQKEDIPKRDYDLLLYGINYGVDRDYYPFWHSSQVSAASGWNVTGTKDKDLDAMLENARREADPAAREVLNQKIEAHLKDKALQRILSQESFNFWTRKTIKGVQYGKIDESADRFHLVWQWHIKSKRVK